VDLGSGLEQQTSPGGVRAAATVSKTVTRKGVGVQFPPRAQSRRKAMEATTTALENRTLLLSQSMEPIKAISWQRAITLLTLGKVEVLSEYDGFVRSSTVVIKIPAVVRLLRAFKRFRQPVKFSRINIYARDRYTCQYCGQTKKIAELTYDHVIPRNQGGRTVWDNITTSCGPCNLKKGGRTPEQAGMHLRSKPAQPKWVPALTVRIGLHDAPEAWRSFMYWTTELDA
jgi:5-methylcytosine-specific restriction endonuclease McrA